MGRKQARESRSHTSSDDDLFTAPEVAQFCKVDLKTIHNWVDREQIKHFRTPGRHLRFRRKDVLDFLKRFDYPIPSELKRDEPSVLVLAVSSSTGLATRKLLGAGLSIDIHEDLFDLLLKAGQQPPDIIVAEAEFPGLDLGKLRATLEHSPLTRTCKLVVLTTDERPMASAERAHADAWVARSAPRELRAVLESMLGL